MPTDKDVYIYNSSGEKNGDRLHYSIRKDNRTQEDILKHCYNFALQLHSSNGFNVTRYTRASCASHQGSDTQVISCHCFLVIFHPLVEQLTVFYVYPLDSFSSLLLSSIFLVLHCDYIMHERHVPERYANWYTSIVNPLWTEIKEQLQTKTPLAPVVPTPLCIPPLGTLQ